MQHVDALFIIAHPDDDGIFGGAIHRALSFLNWGVVCLTHNAENHRGVELVAWQKHMGTKPENVLFLDFPDDPNDLVCGKSSFTVDQIADAVGKLALKPKVVVTHNAVGEYGHPHHIDLHHAVNRLFSNIICFGAGLDHWNIELNVPDFTEELIGFFPTQRPAIESLQAKYQCCSRGRYLVTGDNPFLREQL